MVSAPPTSKSSLIPTGMPWSGPREAPAASSSVSTRASSAALSRVRVVNAPMSGSSLSIRSDRASTTSTGEAAPDR